jgi:hypothetical protein
MNPRAILAAAGGAVVGAVIWGVLAYSTGFEIGYVAWAIGGLIGYAASAMGGRGAVCGALCAVLAVVSIFAGKAIAAQAIITKEMNKITLSSGLLNKDAYTETQADAADFAKVTAESEYPAFMVEHEFTTVKDAQKVTAEDLEDFKTNQVPHLRWMASEKPSFEAWQADRKKQITDMLGENLSLSKVVMKSLGPIDLIFGLLGIATAYRLGFGKGEAETETSKQMT